MTEVDPNIILRGLQPQAPYDPFAMASKVVALQGAQQQNQLLRQTLDARAALGGLYADAYDSQSGTLDQNKLISGMSADPRTAWMVPQGIEEAQAATRGSLGNQRSASDLSASQLGNVSPAIGALPDNATSDDAKAYLSLATKAGTISPERAAAVSGTMPDSAADPAGFKAWRQNFFRNPSLGEQGALDVEHAPIVTVNDGAATDIVQQANRYDGTPAAVVGTVRNRLSPGEMASRATVLGPDNAPRSVPQSLLTDEYGQARSSDLAPGGVARTGLQPGADAAAATAGTGSASILNADLAEANSSGARVFQLQKALNGLQGAKTGPGADQRNTIKSFLLSLAPDQLQRFGITQDQLKGVQSFDEANKYLVQYASGAAAAFGPGTDSKLATALSGNANTHISNLAAQDVVKANIGLERLKQAKIAAWQAAQAQSGGVLGPQDYGTWSANWNRNADPRAFYVDLLSPSQRKSMIDAMSEADRKQFFRNLTAARASGIVQVGQ